MPQQRPRSQNVGGQNPEFTLTNFEGMSNLAAREGIGDNELWWCENAIPLADNNLAVLQTMSQSALTTVAGESGGPTYTQNFNVAGTDYIFAVWKNSGNGWIVNLSSFAKTQIGTGIWTSGSTYAAQYNNQGLLIIDPTGYWDWNVTTASTLTAQNNAVAKVTPSGTPTAFASNSQMRSYTNTSTGSGATWATFYAVTSVTISGGGAGFAVGDIIYLTDGNPVNTATIVVTAVAAGAITGISLTAGGSYPGPTTTGGTVFVGPTGSVFTTTGAGAGATFSVLITVLSVNILTRGTNYANGDLIIDQRLVIAVWHTTDDFSIIPSGVIGGQSIATYAGRVWIASGRIVNFTDVNSYNSFGGAGGAFTINDAYLHNNITALFSANNYLYIFGDSNIDVLSNVTVSASTGLTSFSRLNVTTSVGTSVPTSIVGYYRAVAFFHASGFFILSGSTPERISEKIGGLVKQIVVGGVNGLANATAIGCQIMVYNELCLAFLISFNDIFTLSGNQRPIIAFFFRGKWFVASMAVGNSTYNPVSLNSVVVAGVPTGYFFSGASLYQAINGTTNYASWIVKTKLWDGGAKFREKQAINVALAGVFTGVSQASVSVNIDTELNSIGQGQLVNTAAGYALDVELVNNGGSQYLGVSLSGNSSTNNTGMSRISAIALRGKTERDFLQ